jgi:hypothetical protein
MLFYCEPGYLLIMNLHLLILTLIVILLWFILWKVCVKLAGVAIIPKWVVALIFSLTCYAISTIPYYVGKLLLYLSRSTPDWRGEAGFANEPSVLLRSLSDGFSGDKIWSAILVSLILTCAGLLCSAVFSWKIFHSHPTVQA